MKTYSKTISNSRYLNEKIFSNIFLKALSAIIYIEKIKSKFNVLYMVTEITTPIQYIFGFGGVSMKYLTM